MTTLTPATSPTALFKSTVHYLHPYYPYRSGKFDAASRRVLDFKEGSRRAASYYLREFDLMIPKGVAVAVVPPHAPAERESPVVRLASALATNSRVNAACVLERHTAIEKLSRGGRRSVSVHLASICVREPSIVAGRRVVLLDDVMTTGNSLLACRGLLLDAGASDVACFVIAKTMY